MGKPREIVPAGELLRALAAGDEAAVRTWRGIQEQAAADPGRSRDPEYAAESRSGAPPQWDTAWRPCLGCGRRKALASGEVTCPPCRQRGRAPEPAGRSGGTMSGRQARGILDSQYCDPPEARSLARERQRRRYAAIAGVAGENEYLKWRAARLRAGMAA